MVIHHDNQRGATEAVQRAKATYVLDDAELYRERPLFFLSYNWEGVIVTQVGSHKLLTIPSITGLSFEKVGDELADNDGIYFT